VIQAIRRVGKHPIRTQSDEDLGAQFIEQIIKATNFKTDRKSPAMDDELLGMPFDVLNSRIDSWLKSLPPL
jgi:hypothetical protein